jgi:phage terminase large subunit GpA-like protein
MDAVSDPTIGEIWVQKSAQIGWTEILNNVVGYHVDQDPAPILLVQPTLEMAEAWSKDRLAPMIRDTPRLRDKIADPKARDSGNTLLHKKFTGGHLTIAGANSPAGLASRPIRIVLFDEVDRFPISAGTEGDPVNLGKKRATTFWNRKVLAGSTPTIKDASRIEAGFQASDQRFYFVPCPHCGEFQRLVWSQVVWQGDDAATAAYACEHCGTLLVDADKPEMLRRGEWRSTKPFDGIAGFHISELYSPWVTWQQMVASYLAARTLPETLQTWFNTSLGETYEQKGDTVEPDSLLERKEQYDADSIPSGVLMLTAGVDVQDDRIEVQVDGWGTDEENWIVEQKVFRGDPGKPALWLEVDEYLLRRFPTEDGRALLIEAVGVDSGGHHTQAVYQFVVSRKRRRVWALKGMAGAGKLAWPKKASRTAKSRAMVFIIGVDTIKGVLYGRLAKVAEPGPGYIHLHADATEDFCKQLTSEKALTKYVRGRRTVVWEPRSKNQAQEAQDCWNYAYAAFLGRRGPELLKRLARRVKRDVAPQASEQSEQSAPAQPDALPEPAAPPEHAARVQRRSRPPQSRGWVRSWRW